jgi:hypothetical protein
MDLGWEAAAMRTARPDRTMRCILGKSITCCQPVKATPSPSSWRWGVACDPATEQQARPGICPDESARCHTRHILHHRSVHQAMVRGCHDLVYTDGGRHRWERRALPSPARIRSDGERQTLSRKESKSRIRFRTNFLPGLCSCPLLHH